MSKRGGVLEVFLQERGQRTYLREGRVCLGPERKGEIIQIKYNMNFIKTRLQKISQHFKSTSYWLSKFGIIQKSTFPNARILNCLQRFSKRTLKCSESFEKLLQPVTFLKMLLFHRYFSAGSKEQYHKIFDLFQSFSSPFQQAVTLLLLHSNSRVFLLDITNERCRFLIQPN